MASRELETIIRLKGKVDNSLNAAFRAVESKAAKVMKSLPKNIGSAMLGAGKAAAAGLTAAASAAGAFAVAAAKTGSEFEAAMSQVSATMMVDKGTQAYETLEQAARKMGRETSFSATEGAEALNYLALAGYDAEQAAAALPTVYRVAGAGAMGLADASDLVTDAMSSLGIAVTQTNLEAFSDKLAMTSSKSNTSIKQLGAAILEVGGTARGMAGGITELNTALGILADNGIKGAEGGTHLRNMLLSLQNPNSSEAAASIQKLIGSAYDAQGEMRGLDEIFMQMNANMKGFSAKQINKELDSIFKLTDQAAVRAMLAATADSVEGLTTQMDSALYESGKSVQSLGIDIDGMSKSFDKATQRGDFAAQMLSEYGLDAEQAGILFNGLQSIVNGTGNRFQELSGKIADSKGAAEEMYRKQKDNLRGDVEQLGSAFDDLKIAIYGVESGALRSLAQTGASTLASLTETFEKGDFTAFFSELGTTLSEGVQMAVENLPGLVNIAQTLLNSLMDGISANAASIGGGMGKLGATLANALISLAPRMAVVGWQLFAAFAEGIVESWPETRAALLGSFDYIRGVMEGAMTELPSMLPGIKSALMAGLGDLGNFGVSMMSKLADALPNGIPIIAQGLAGALRMALESLPGIISVLMEAGTNLMTGLGQGIINSIPVLVEVLPQAGASLGIGLMNVIANLPSILEAGLRLVMMLGQTIYDNLPIILEAALGLVMSFGQGLWDNMPMLIEAGAQLVSYISQGTWSAFSLMADAAIALVMNLGQALWNAAGTLIDSGVQLVQSVAQGAWNTAGALIDAFLGMGRQAIEAFKGIDWLSLGKSVVEGIASGITGAARAVGDAVVGLGKKAVGWAKSSLKINSPSKVFRDEVGAFIPEGVAEGITKNMKPVLDSLGKLSDKSLKELKGSLSQGIESLSKTISGQMDIFSKFSIEEALDPAELISNMESQIKGVTDWANQMQALAARGVDQGLLQKLGDMGPQGMKYVSAFSKMTNEQLVKANALFAQSIALPTAAAGQVMGSYAHAGAMAAQGFTKGIDKDSATAGKSAGKLAEDALKVMKAVLGIHSPSTVTHEIGTNLDIGLVNGIEANSGQVTTALGRIREAIASTLGAVDLAPLGASMISGLAAGMESNEAVAIETASRVATASSLGIRTEFDGLLAYINGTFQNGWRTSWDGIGKIAISAFDKAKSAVRSAIGKVVSAINALIGGVNTISGAVGIPAIPLIPVPQFAEGGTVTAPTLAMVGEAGPETIVPHNNSDRSRQLLREAAAGVYGAQASRSPGSSYNITFAPTINGGGDPEETAEIVMEKFRSWYEQMKRDDLREAYAQ